ncbi:MAG TPA: hypothetical protein VKC17_05700 [Sphingomicrobium sp.]|nr:hypothetical protein [Sphingomicrobium sp.]
MQTARPAIANDPRSFGRGFPRGPATGATASRLSDDFKLFATTFLAGFVFVSVFLA